MRENEQTVLILGAGASADYGLPIGRGLRQWILKHARTPLLNQIRPTASARWLVLGGEEGTAGELLDTQAAARVETFINAFGRTGDVTVDEFLRDNTRHSNLGRLAIAHCLLAAQDRALELPDLGEGCYDPIRRWVSASENRVHALDRLKIINFNYDRTFDYLLATMLASGGTFADASAAAEQIDRNTIHPYGSFRLPYEFDPDSVRFMRMSSAGGGHAIEHTPQDYEAAANGIDIIGREQSEHIAQRFAAARAWLGDAKNVYILGFGYDRMNVERLGLAGNTPICMHPRCRLVCTAYGLDDQRRNEVEKFLWTAVNTHTVVMGTNDQKGQSLLNRLGDSPLA